MYIGNTYTIEDSDLYSVSNIPAWAASYVRLDPTTAKLQVSTLAAAPPVPATYLDLVAETHMIYIDIMVDPGILYLQEIVGEDEAIPSPVRLYEI